MMNILLIMLFVMSSSGKDSDWETYQYVVQIEVYPLSPMSEEEYEAGVFRRVPSCTGAYLTSTCLISSAHCFAAQDKLFRDIYDLSPKWIVWYKSSATSANFSKIVTFHVHPEYHYNEAMFMENDITLAKTLPVKLTKYAYLSPLNITSFLGQDVLAIGYGLFSSEQTLKSPLNKTLQVLNSIIKICPGDLREFGCPMTCLSSLLHEEVGTCPGDSGGPLIHYSGVVGVYSLESLISCNVKNYKKQRSVYQNKIIGVVCPISPFKKWISNAMKKSSKFNRIPLKNRKAGFRG